jgi:hypothetical protein
MIVIGGGRREGNGKKQEEVRAKRTGSAIAASPEDPAKMRKNER